MYMWGTGDVHIDVLSSLRSWSYKQLCELLKEDAGN